MERTKTFIEGPGGREVATFSWKDDVINQKESNKNISNLKFKQNNKVISDLL